MSSSAARLPYAVANSTKRICPRASYTGRLGTATSSARLAASTPSGSEVTQMHCSFASSPALK